MGYSPELTALLEKNNFQQKPGCHTVLSPVTGARFRELFLIQQFREVFIPYQQEVYDHQNIYVIPLQYKQKADERAKQLFDQYILKYQDTAGLTSENIVDWTPADQTAKCALAVKETSDATWHQHIVVPSLDNNNHVRNGHYVPAHIGAIHEIMHAEERPKGAGDDFLCQDVIEVLTATKTLLLNDEVYKSTLGLDLNEVVDYGPVFVFSGKRISAGELANFYRGLLNQYDTLAEALISPESMRFLNCDPQIERTCRSRLHLVDQRVLQYEKIQLHEFAKKRFVIQHTAQARKALGDAEVALALATETLSNLRCKIRAITSMRNPLSPMLERLSELNNSAEITSQQVENELALVLAYRDALNQKTVEANALAADQFPPIDEIPEEPNPTESEKNRIVPTAPAPNDSNAIQKIMRGLNHACTRYLAHHRKNNHAAILRQMLEKFPINQANPDDNQLYQQVLTIEEQLRGRKNDKNYTWFFNNKADMLGAIKFNMVSRLRDNMTANEATPRQAFLRISGVISNPQDKTMEVLSLDRQSGGEYGLKILALITVVFAIAAACFRLYKTGGNSINFFKPLSDQTVNESLREIRRENQTACQL